LSRGDCDYPKRNATPNSGNPFAEIIEANQSFHKQHPEIFAAARKGLYAL